MENKDCPRRFFSSVLGMIAIAFLSGVGGGFLALNFVAELVPENLKEQVSVKTVVEERNYIEESQSVAAIEKVNPAVISVVASKDLEVYYRDPFDFFEGVTREIRREQVGGGSAFIISADGMAVTNNHVVLDAKADYGALTRDGRRFEVEVLASDPGIDIALIQLYETNDKGEKKKPENFNVIKFGSSANLKVGQKVLAIGNALGQYGNTVTSGIVSGIGREIVAGDRRGYSEQLLGLIQTDAAINPGNSGGPLVNLSGEVIGVNVAIDREAENIGFAVPIDDVSRIVESFRQNGRIVKPVLGVRYLLLDEIKAKELGLGVNYGALLVGDEAKGEFAVIPGGAADKAGLKIRDVILEVDGKKIQRDFTLQKAIRGRKAGEKIQLKVWRSGKEFEQEAVLEELKQSV